MIMIILFVLAFCVYLFAGAINYYFLDRLYRAVLFESLCQNVLRGGNGVGPEWEEEVFMAFTIVFWPVLIPVFIILLLSETII